MRSSRSTKLIKVLILCGDLTSSDPLVVGQKRRNSALSSSKGKTVFSWGFLVVVLMVVLFVLFCVGCQYASQLTIITLLLDIITIYLCSS